MMNEDQKFIDAILKSIVEFPNDVKTERIVDEKGVLITITVNPADMGKVIGRAGSTVEAIRTLVRIVGMKNQARVNVKINDPRVIKGANVEDSYNEAKSASPKRYEY